MQKTHNKATTAQVNNLSPTMANKSNLSLTKGAEPVQLTIDCVAALPGSLVAREGAPLNMYEESNPPQASDIMIGLISTSMVIIHTY